MSKFSIIILSLSFFFPVNGIVNGQGSVILNNFTRARLLLETEQLLGLDDLLVYGKTYRPDRINVNGNPNFEWDKGTGTRLYIKGQCFDHVDLTYDIATDQLVLNQPLNKDIERQVLLHPELVDSFYLGNQLFINQGKMKSNTLGSIYFEQVTYGRALFLKKYKKTFIKIYDSSNKGKYSPQKAFYYLMDEGKLISVNSRHAFLSFYANHKKEIRDFMRSNDIAYRKASNKELKNLMTYCYALSKEDR